MIPKYRAWDYDGKRMHDVLVIDWLNRLVDLDFGDIEKPFGRVKLMQSTRLKDKNGVEIYEGDIVKVTDDDGRTDFSDGGIGTICGLDELYMWYIDGQVHNGLFDINGQYYIEVIGNIYENPELLEVAE